ncbi:MAG: hypothetical protein R3A46_16590 [Thermomicrobiales bacterium]
MRDAGPDRKMDVYFTRVYNPVWTMIGRLLLDRDADRREPDQDAHCPDPDLERDELVRRLRPADGPHPNGTTTRARKRTSRWFGFRQRSSGFDGEDGPEGRFTWQANPGEVWEEDEFFIELSWRIDPDGELGIRKLRIAIPAGREDRRRRALPLDVREHCPRPARGKPRGRG